jgi:WD40 repeat protein
MVAGSSDGSQSVWNAVTGECIHNLAAGGDAGHEGPVSAVAALGGGRHVSGGWDGTVRVWHAQKGLCERILAVEPRSKVTALAPLGLGRLAVATADGAVRVWDAARGVLMHHLGDHSGWVTFLAATPDGRLVSGCADNCVRLWDPLSGSCIRVFPASPGDAQVPCFAAQGVSGRLTTGRWCFTLPAGHDMVVEAKALS